MGRRDAFANRKRLEQEVQSQGLSWPELIRAIDKGNLIPIISNSVINDQLFELDEEQIDHMSGSVPNPLGWSIEEQLADTWAGAIGFPLPQQHWMPRVALFDRVVNSRSDSGSKTRYLNFLKEYFIFVCEQEKALDEGKLELMQEEYEQNSFADVAAIAGFPRPVAGAADTLDLLAKMKLPIYITTSPFDFLERAIKNNHVEPRTQICFWSGEPTNWIDKSHKGDHEFEPTPENPLVYHIFGHEAYPESMVLNEDDYFDFLVRISQDTDTNNPLIPLYLREALTKASLLLLGYRLRDWDFRVMFRGLIKPNPSPTKKYNLSIQLDPDKLADSETAEKVKKYLDKYFDEGDFAVQFDSAHEFTVELYEKWSEN